MKMSNLDENNFLVQENHLLREMLLLHMSEIDKLKERNKTLEDCIEQLKRTITRFKNKSNSILDDALLDNPDECDICNEFDDVLIDDVG